jgi:hypothetical protein
MREHQIVITLKPDQFLQVQKLAKNAGAKSMGMFVRQHLLAALGIEGVQETASALDLEPALTDLKRLHGELKGFVAESLASFGTDFLAESNPPFDSDQAPDALMAALAPLLDDDMEKTAEQTFAISPRLGAMESENTADVAEKITVQEEIKATVQENPNTVAEFSFTAPVLMPKGNKYNFFNALAPESDEQKRDPLSELLGDEENSEQGQMHQEDDDSFDVPLSILARRQQLQAQKKAIEASSGMSTPQPREKPAASVPPAKPLSQNSDLQVPGRPSSSESVSQAASAPAAQPTPAQKPVIRPLDNPEEDPPLSGGPPPKKRQ